MRGNELRLAVIISHPTQYYSPWFRHLAERMELQLKVFYLWDSGVKETRDQTFGTTFSWDIPLLDGYDHEFVPNRAKEPGSHHFRGLDNPGAASVIARWRPDVLLIFGYNFLTHLRLLVSFRLRHIPFLFRGDSHDLHRQPSWKQSLAKRLRRLIFRRFSAFLAVGEANAAYFRNHGVADRMLFHVPHCVDNDRFRNNAGIAEMKATDWKRELKIPQGVPVILFAGKFEEKKCPAELLRTFLNMEASNQASSSASGRIAVAVLLLVGNGPLENELREIAGSAVGRTVFFAPFQNQTEMPKVYAAGDVLVLPSYGQGETWGLAVNEAMNLGRPVIVSSHVGCASDLIISGETGWVFEAGDWDSLRETIGEALADPRRLKDMGARARQHVAAYSYERATQGLLQALEARIGR